ncbi:MAG TPA: DUF6542 domain-containing protein [Actinophytocola sp.]|uniref:DUF6542 domain-containing protein n=1 Tax=Actinophytocola sp. TaxID=1872138 RepID=UPI002DB85894|nr:DUF6542 domain-containing protein [Actinophytocola sp.]HEU5472068.1 DUF6542 domain-containing protein [Actinophytocola sp.]
MTATRDRSSDLEDEPAELAWDERPVFGNFRGLPWWAAVLLAFGVAGIAAVVDIQRQGSLGRIYQVAYVLGCVLAVAWVRRRNLFGPIVQPPLVFAVTAIGAIVFLQSGSPLSGGVKALVFSVALPLTSNFPTMGVTTAIVVVIGVLRLWLQRNPNPPVRPSRSSRGRETLDTHDARESRRTPPDRAGEGSDRRRTADRRSPRSRPAAEPDPFAQDQFAAEDRWAETPRPPRAQPPADRPRGSTPRDPNRRRRPDQDPDQRRRR